MSGWIGQTLLGRYRVLERLGAGGMAAVYLAEDVKRPGWKVAVKHPLRAHDAPAGRISDEELRRRFKTEVQKLIALGELPNVARIEDQGEHEGVPFYVMRYLAGGTLSQRLEAGSQGPDDVVAWALPIARALDRLHSRRPMLVHRDVKPHNILFDEYDQPHLADFGIVKELSEEWGTTGAENSVIGSPPYMAPEQLLKDGEPDGRTDQYALSASMYQALTGQPPRYETRAPTAGTPPTGPGAARRKRLVPARELAAHLAPAASAALERGLAKEQDERFPTCVALVEAFAAGLAAETSVGGSGGGATLVPPAVGTQVHVPRSEQTGARPAGGRRWLLLLAALLALGGIGYAVLSARGGGAPPERGTPSGGPPAQVPAPAPGPGPTAPLAPVVADTQAPEVRVSDPASDVTTTAAQVTLAGTVSERGGLLSAVVLKDGAVAVALEATGAFTYEVPLSVDEERVVTLVATDGAGNASAAVVRRFKREALWAGPLREAEAARAKEDGEAVKAALSKAKAADVPFAKVEPLSEYVRQWDAEPVVQVTGASPVGEATPGGPPRPMRVTGTFQSGRAGDRLLVDGREAAAKPGAFTETVTRSTPGAVEVAYEVRAASGAVRKQGTFPVTFETPAPKPAPTPAPTPPAQSPVPAWAKVSSAQNAEAQRLGVLVAYEEPTTGLRFVLIPGGTFQMGAPDGETGRASDEGPVHTVRMSPYYLSVTEVTNAQFERFVTATGHRTTAETEGTGHQLTPEKGWQEVAGASWRQPLFGGRRQADWAQHPVVLVSWEDATAFAMWAQAALPTEAQFERALRGGVADRKYPWGGTDAPPARFGNYAGQETKRAFPKWSFPLIKDYDDGYAVTAPVGSFEANSFGLFDVSGNVWEWCQDAYDDSFYGKAEATQTDPRNDSEGPATRVSRGGGWFDDKRQLRSAYRNVDRQPTRYDYLGFRLAKPVTTR